MMDKRREHDFVGSNMKYILYLSGFLDLFGVSMVMPLILPHAQDIGASSTLAGVIGSVYGGIQLVSSPVVGKWSDRVGRQFSLLVCLFLSGCGYSILGLYSSLAVLFAGRFFLGCFKHSQTITKAFLADIGPDHERSALLGNFNSFSNIGFVVGPIIGGHLAEISFHLTAFAAGFVFIGNAGFSVIIFRGNFTLVLKQKFDASPKTIGYIISYSGAISTLSGFLIGKITDRYNSTAQLILHVTILQVVTLLCLTLSTSIYLIFIFLTPLSIVTSISRVAGATLTISRSGDTKIGSVMGLSQSVMAVARMSAPFFAGVAQEFSLDGAAFISVISAAMSVLIMLVRPQDPRVRQKLLA